MQDAVKTALQSPLGGPNFISEQVCAQLTHCSCSGRVAMTRGAGVPPRLSGDKPAVDNGRVANGGEASP
ncbi:unnamed protein product [Danaus chrysippus]|uniref:(African queen) hypothetical protein n=1 Tax=Danaus chrysippus TaxID=151541 RepID=A0A8J2QZT5_9NEOP|nr:unnamed protein product [Danaus chrysippus]